MSRFFVYEEYGAKFETMLHEMTLAAKNVPNWQAYERGLEALANTLAPNSGSDLNPKKGLTFADLLIKVCNANSVRGKGALTYPSLFNESANTHCCLQIYTG